MQQSAESLSTSDELNAQALNDFKETVVDLLTKETVSENDITQSSIKLREHPLFTVEVKEKLIDEESFYMLKQSEINPVFTLNLLNTILIVNYVWNAVKKNIHLFHKILLDLNIMFSYILQNDNQEIGYALLTTVPIKFYELIAEKGRNCFKGNYDFNKDFLSFDKNISQVGLVYQESTIAHLNSMLEKEQIEAPNIMYFLYEEKCSELFKKSVLNRPENYLSLKYSLTFGSYGVKEIDYSFILSNDIKVKENLIFNKVYEDKEITRFFNSNSNQNILELKKDTNIFVEIKSRLESIEAVRKMIDTSDLFEQAYKNLAFNDIEKKFSRQKVEYYLLYNTNRDEAFGILGELKNEAQQDKIQKTKVVYNSGYVQISSIVSLQNQIRSLNFKMDKMKSENENQKEEMQKFEEENNKIKDEMKEMKKTFEEETIKIKDEVKEMKKEMSISQKIFEFKIKNHIELKEIQDILKNIGSVLTKDLLKFTTMHTKYSLLCLELLKIEMDNNILNTADKVIGKLLESEDEKKEFFNFLSLLDKKISEKKFVAPYYEAFKSTLTGPIWNYKYTPKNFQKLDIFSKSKFKDIIIKILRFIVVLEHEPEIENNFFEAMLYYVYKISETDISCYNLFYLYKDENDLRTTISKFIKSINSANHDSLS
jgi:hypothetical protein